MEEKKNVLTKIKFLKKEFNTIGKELSDDLHEANLRKQAIDDEYNAKKMAIFKKLSDEGKVFKVGDIVSGGFATICVEDYHIISGNIGGETHYDFYYKGRAMKKNLLPKDSSARVLVPYLGAKLIESGEKSTYALSPFHANVGRNGEVFFDPREWQCTDIDNVRYCRHINDTTFEFIQLKESCPLHKHIEEDSWYGKLERLSGLTKEDDWYEEVINITNYDADVIGETLAMYGFSNWDKYSKETQNQLTAECLFEQNYCSDDE